MISHPTTPAHEVYLLITIDTECDHDNHWARSLPLTYQSVIVGIPDVLQPIFSQLTAVPTYLLTVEVMENTECVQSLQNITGVHELGTHLHAGFVEPEKHHYDYAGVDCPDFQCHYTPEVEYQKLANLTCLFAERFSYRPVCFRAGRFGAGAQTIDALEKLGYVMDTSVTPHILWREPKGKVDYRQAPEQPYFPAMGTIVTPGAFRHRTLLEVPVTMKKRWLRGPQWFRPWFSSVAKMKAVVRYHLKRYASNRIVVINMMFHSMEVIPKASPYPQTADDVKRFTNDLYEALYWCKNEGIKFSSAKEFYFKFTNQPLSLTT